MGGKKIGKVKVIFINSTISSDHCMLIYINIRILQQKYKGFLSTNKTACISLSHFVKLKQQTPVSNRTDCTKG